MAKRLLNSLSLLNPNVAGGIIIAFISITLHFISLEHPREVVFDEVHFGKFVTSYCCSHENFFDIHPPHAKLLIAAAARAGGFTGSNNFDTIGNAYGDTSLFALRVLPALTGVLISCLCYIILLQLGTRTSYAFVGALLVALDNGLLLQTRIVALDGFLILGIFGSLSAHLAALQTSSRGRSWGWLLSAGCLMGLAVGSKFTGLTAVVLNGFIAIGHILRHKKFRTPAPLFAYLTIPLVGAIAFYLWGWWWHWELLSLRGSGDAFYRPTGHFWSDTLAMHKVMFAANYNLTAGHPYASAWWQWPLMTRGIFYWTRGDAFIYFIGNPALWWGASLLSGVAFAAWIFSIWSQKKVGSKALWILFSGYMIAYLPYIGVPRVLFLYHYLPPLLFSWLFSVVWLDTFFKEHDSYKKHESKMLIAIVAVGLLGFGFISPLTYGYIPMKSHFNTIFGLFPHWR